MVMDWKDFRRMALDMVEKGRIPVYGEFCLELQEIIIECIHFAEKRGQKKITLVINSGGGWFDTFSAIKGAMSDSSIEFTGMVVSKAKSSAFHLLQHCHRRIALKDANLMFHWGTQRLNNGDISSLMDGDTWVLDHLVRLRKQSAEDVSKRSGVVSVADLYKFALYEREFSGEEAKDFGFVDEVIDGLPKGLEGHLGATPAEGTKVESDKKED